MSSETAPSTAASAGASNVTQNASNATQGIQGARRTSSSSTSPTVLTNGVHQTLNGINPHASHGEFKPQRFHHNSNGYTHHHRHPKYPNGRQQYSSNTNSSAVNYNPYANGYYYPTYYDPRMYYNMQQNPQAWQNAGAWTFQNQQPMPRTSAPPASNHNDHGQPSMAGIESKNPYAYMDGSVVNGYPGVNGNKDATSSSTGGVSNEEDDDVEFVLNKETKQSRRPPTPNVDEMSPEELRNALKKQLTYYFSLENLANDAFLVAQMNSDLYVPIAIIAQFKKVHKLTKDINLITSVFEECENVIVDDEKLRVKPKISMQRNTLILRDIPADVQENELIDLFSGPSGRNVKNVGREFGNHWFVTFESEDDAVRMLFYIRSQRLRGQPVTARIKSENILKGFYDTERISSDQMHVAGGPLTLSQPYPYPIDGAAAAALAAGAVSTGTSYGTAPSHYAPYYGNYGYSMQGNWGPGQQRQTRSNKNERISYNNLSAETNSNPGHSHAHVQSPPHTRVNTNDTHVTSMSSTIGVNGFNANSSELAMTNETSLSNASVATAVSPKARSTSSRTERRMSIVSNPNMESKPRKADSDVGRRRSKATNNVNGSNSVSGRIPSTNSEGMISRSKFDNPRRRSTTASSRSPRSKSKTREGKGRAKSVDRNEVVKSTPPPNIGADSFPPLASPVNASNSVTKDTNADKENGEGETTSTSTSLLSMTSKSPIGSGWSNIAQALGQIKPGDQAFKPLSKKQTGEGNSMNTNTNTTSSTTSTTTTTAEDTPESGVSQKKKENQGTKKHRQTSTGKSSNNAPSVSSTSSNPKSHTTLSVNPPLPSKPAVDLTTKNPSPGFSYAAAIASSVLSTPNANKASGTKSPDFKTSTETPITNEE